MAVSEPRHDGVAAGVGRRLHVCVQCGSGLVHPVDWHEAGRAAWTVTLRCPNCEWTISGKFTQSEVDSFDEQLDRGGEALMRDLRQLARANMADYVERFAGALDAGAILPEDF